MLVGRIAAAHGVRGDLKVQPLTDFPERFQRLGSIFVGPSHEERLITAAHRRGDAVIIRLQDVESREEAQALRGVELWVPRAEATPLPPGQFYHDDIIGLQVQTADGALVGVVSDILVTGANDVYVVDGDEGEILIPAIADVVVGIEVDQGRITVNPMPGMLE